jgi:hypothetical protein
MTSWEENRVYYSKVACPHWVTYFDTTTFLVDPDMGFKLKQIRMLIQTCADIMDHCIAEDEVEEFEEVIE